jgi:carboxyl-terminal processing protease
MAQSFRQLRITSLLTTLAFVLWAAASAANSNGERVIAEIDAHYLEADSPAWRDARKKIAASGETDVYRLARLVDSVGDPDLHLISPADSAALQAEINGARVGIGLIGFALEIVPGQRPRVVTPLIGSPAARAGIQPGDRLVAVNHRSTRDLDRDELMSELRRGQRIDLIVERAGQRRVLKVTPDPRPLVPVRTKLERGMGSPTGVVRILQFTPGVSQQVAEALERLDAAGVSDYVIDLRENPGGLLDQAAATARLFGAQDLGELERADERREPITSATPARPRKPLVIVIDGGTASAAEYFAAVMRLMPRTRIVGLRGAGRGKAQAYVPLADGWGIVIPSARLILEHRDIEIDPPTPDEILTNRQFSFDEALREATRVLREIESRGP